VNAALERTVRFAPAAGGARIAWASSGQGPVVVRTAHWMTHVEHDRASPLWAPWLARLSRRLELVRYDGRGFGLSGDAGTPPDLAHAVEDLDAVVQARGAPRVALLGISSGAAAAVAYAAAHPDRVSHLVLLGGFALGMLRHELGAEQRQLVEATIQLMSLGWGRRNPAVQQYFTTTMLPGASAEQAQALNEQQRLSCTPRATRWCRPRWAATWRRASRAPGSSRSTPATMCRWRASRPSSGSASWSRPSSAPPARRGLSSPRASGSCWSSWRRAGTTCRSRRASAWPTRRCATRFRSFTRVWRWKGGLRRS
jgi:pimeloyl-ACP methyl ester carboxylesterase